MDTIDHTCFAYETKKILSSDGRNCNLIFKESCVTYDCVDSSWIFQNSADF